MVGVWDPTKYPGQALLEEGREGGNRSTDRLMALALHTIEFALLSLPALGKGLSWELSWIPRATGPGSARPDSIREMKDMGLTSSPMPRGAGGRVQKDKAREGTWGPRVCPSSVPPPESLPIPKTQLTIIYNIHHPLPPSHLS